ncbi:hypothetical protein ACLOAV_009698 [Pseudogymnoascus australis]
MAGKHSGTIFDGKKASPLLSVDPVFIDHILPNYNFNHPSNMASQSAIAHPEHITLPFDLRTNPEAFYEAENSELLGNLFPGNYGLSMDGLFLIFLQREMPPKPWPKPVAGLTPYFAPKNGTAVYGGAH